MALTLCRDLDLFGRELIAVDGTRIKAVNSRERNFTKAKLDKALAESDERLARYLKQLDAADLDDEARYTNRSACRACTLKARCTNAGFRVVNRFENVAVLERMADRLATRPDVLDRRRESVEHPFGSIKQWMGQGAF